MSIAGLLLLTLTLATQAERAEGALKGEEIRRAIKQLHDDRFVVRHAAMQQLWETGELARAALEEAAKSPDREAASRARSVLEQFRWGLYHDTPEAEAKLIKLFRFGRLDDKQLVLQQLREQGNIASVLRLIEAEPDANARKQLTSRMFKELDKVVSHLIRSNDLQGAERLVRLSATNELGMNHYAVFLNWSGKLDAEIERLTQQPNGAQENALQLTYFHRMKGDLNSALRSAELTKQARLLEELNHEAGRWSELANHLRYPAGQPETFSTDIEKLGVYAAACRLAGKHEEFSRTMAEIDTLVRKKPDQIWYVAEALLLNDRWEDGVVLLGQYSQYQAVRLMVMQSRFKDAFLLAGMQADASDHAEWFAQAIKDSTSKDNKKQSRFQVAAQVVRALHFLGRRELVKKYLAELAEVARADQDANKRRLRTIVQVTAKLGLTELAFEQAAESLDGASVSPLLGVLFSDHKAEAPVWWSVLETQHPEQENLERLLQIRRLLNPDEDQKKPAAELEALAAKFRLAAGQQDDRKRADWLKVLAETCKLHDQRDLALQYLRQAAELQPKFADEVAHLLVERKEFAEAAAWYGKAFQANNQNAGAYYLQGWCLTKCDRTKEGRTKIRAAQLMPLANSKARHELGSYLKARGLMKEASVEWETLLRSGRFRDWYLNDASKELGNALSGKDNARTAEYWDRLARSGLRRSSAFSEVTSYLQLPHLVHKARARSHFDQGDPYAAFSEVWLAHAALPNNTGVVEEFVPKLDEAGLKRHADDLFAQVYRRYEEICATFPDSALHRNNLAWMCTQVDRRLDDALKYAKSAVKLEPEKAMYIDTLAEVHFRQGDREQAIQLAKKCLKLEPKDEHFQKQLKRFESEKK